MFETIVFNQRQKEWTIRYSAQFKDGYDFFVSIVRTHSNKECLVFK